MGTFLSGIDELSAEVLKISALAIVTYLQKLINQTFSQSEFPDCLKIAKKFHYINLDVKPTLIFLDQFLNYQF